MNLINIKDYVQKTAGIISTVAEMQVLICNVDFQIIGDSKEYYTKQSEIRRLTANSMLAETIVSRKMMMIEDCKNNFSGCMNCPERDSCDIHSMLSIPILDGSDMYGAVGLYAHGKEAVRRLIEKNKDFLEFVHRMSELLVMKLKEASKTKELEKTVKMLQNHQSNISFDDVIGSSRIIREIKAEARQFAKGNANILIQGESGTGKEIFARAIHAESGYAGGPFVAISCAALPENLIESELFGYEEGSFTGAVKGGKIGKFELAHKGTLFLDEIGEFPIHLQAKLLRALQEKKIRRIGGNREIDVDVRIIAATNRNLEEFSKTGQFREDLFYRLSVIPLQLPPLRQRKSDISLLAEYFLRIYAKELNKDLFGFDKKSMERLYDYSWPGNIRELQNAVEYAVNISSTAYIEVSDLPKKLLEHKKSEAQGLVLKPLRFVEDEYIREAIRVYGDSLEGKLKAAEVLGISKATLYRRLKEM